MVSIPRGFQSGKFNPIHWLDDQMIESICESRQYRWRDVKLGPAQTLRHFAWQILMGNVSCDDVKHHANGDFTASAYCQARQRLPLEILADVSRRLIEMALHCADGKTSRSAKTAQRLRWRGHRVFRIDGTGTSLPDSKALRRHFGCSARQKPGCGYPTAHLLLLTGPGGIGVDVICSPLRTGDAAAAPAMHARLEPGDIVLGDRSFSGWAHLYQLYLQQLHGVFPAHHSRRIAWGAHADHGTTRQFVKSLGYRDQLVKYKKPGVCPKTMDHETFRAAPQWLLVRETQRCVKIGGVRRTIVLVSTLTDPQAYPPSALVKLLGERWLIETQIRSLKTTMGLERLRCQSVDGVRKELLMYLIVYNLVRLLMLQAARIQNVPVGRISFADALARLRYGQLVVWTNLDQVRYRPGRHEPRAVKRRRKSFPLMTHPRQAMRRHLLETMRRKHAA